MRARADRLLLVLALPCVVAGCGAAVAPSAPPATPSGALSARTFEGTVRFQARHPTPTGASSAFELRPARFVEVRVLADDGGVLGRTETDAFGRFTLAAGAGARKLEVVASIEHEGHDLRVAADPRGSQVYFHAIQLPTREAPLQVVIGDDGVAGAFHILDSLLRGSLATRAWTGRRLPPFFVYWARGRTSNWSFYRGEQPEGSGLYMVELLGGELGAQATTDTDEHDEDIVLHEFGHFVMDTLSTDSSPGGDHPTGVLLCPGLAWEEGRATWFATAVLGSSRYQDSIGVEPRGSLRVNEDVESGGTGPRGPGSEDGVAEILWDLADGVPELPDRDDDGIALGPARVIDAMISLAERPGAFPAISTYLRYLVDSGIVGAAPLARLLARGGHPASLLPNDDVSRWPIDIPLGAKVSAKIDSMADPTPGGGPPRFGNGEYAVDVYRVHVAERGWLTADMRIFGSGRADDHQDLDLELRTIRADLLDGVVDQEPRETVSKPVEPGWYIIYVRDGGNGTRVGYELQVTLQP